MMPTWEIIAIVVVVVMVALVGGTALWWESRHPSRAKVTPFIPVVSPGALIPIGPTDQTHMTPLGPKDITPSIPFVSVIQPLPGKSGLFFYEHETVLTNYYTVALMAARMGSAHNPPLGMATETEIWPGDQGGVGWVADGYCVTGATASARIYFSKYTAPPDMVVVKLNDVNHYKPSHLLSLQENGDVEQVPASTTDVSVQLVKVGVGGKAFVLAGPSGRLLAFYTHDPQAILPMDAYNIDHKNPSDQWGFKWIIVDNRLGLPRICSGKCEPAYLSSNQRWGHGNTDLVVSWVKNSDHYESLVVTFVPWS
jgi:hypothetical protein